MEIDILTAFLLFRNHVCLFFPSTMKRIRNVKLSNLSFQNQWEAQLKHWQKEKLVKTGKMQKCVKKCCYLEYQRCSKDYEFCGYCTEPRIKSEE